MNAFCEAGGSYFLLKYLAIIRPGANFPLGSVYGQAFANGVWMGNSLGKLKNFRDRLLKDMNPARLEA